MNAEILGTKQPMKLAAMEAQWETKRGRADEPACSGRTRRTSATPSRRCRCPKLLSLLAHYDANAEVKGLKEVPPAERPPVLPVFLLVPRHGRPRVPVHRAVGVGRRSGAASRPVEPAAAARLLVLVDPAALPRQRARLDARRGRSPAVDRLRRDADRRRGVADRHRAGRRSPRWASSWSTRCSGSPTSTCSPSSRGAGRPTSSPGAGAGAGSEGRCVMLETIWFVLWGVLWTGVLRARRVRPRPRHADAVPGQERRRAAGDLQRAGAVLGRQRGVAADRRRRDVRGVPEDLRRDVLRALHAADAAPVRAHPARHLLRDALEGGRRRGGGRPGTPAWWWAAFLPALLLGVAFANIFAGLPIDAAGHLPRQPAHPAQPVRAARRGAVRAAVRRARLAVAGDQDRGRDARAGRPHGRPAVAGCCSWSPSRSSSPPAFATPLWTQRAGAGRCSWSSRCSRWPACARRRVFLAQAGVVEGVGRLGGDHRGRRRVRRRRAVPATCCRRASTRRRR